MSEPRLLVDANTEFGGISVMDTGGLLRVELRIPDQWGRIRTLYLDQTSYGMWMCDRNPESEPIASFDNYSGTLQLLAFSPLESDELFCRLVFGERQTVAHFESPIEITKGEMFRERIVRLDPEFLKGEADDNSVDDTEPGEEDSSDMA